MADNDDKEMEVETSDERGQYHDHAELHMSVESGDLSLVTELVNAGASVESRNDGATLLHIAADFGHTPIIEFLLSKKADPDTVDQFGNTPLHIAASNGYLSMVTALVTAGASMTVRNNDGCTPLHWAAYYGYADIIMYLLSKDVYPDPVDQSGNTPLYNAVYFGHLIVVKELVNAGASMVKKNNDGITPLYAAVERRDADIVEFYVTHRTCSNRDRIESLELLGAAYVSKDNNINVGYHYMFRAMREQLYTYSPFFNLKKNVLPAVEAYGDRLECRNLQELMNIQDDHNALHMEASMVLERVMGEESLAVPREITLHSLVLAKTSHFDLAISLLKRVIHLNHKYDRYIYEGLENLCSLYLYMLCVGEPIKVNYVMDTLELCLKDIKRDQARLKGPDMSVDVATQVSNDRNISAALNLLDIMVHITKSDEEETCLFRLVKGLNDIKLTVFSSNQALTPLHVLCDNHCNHNALLVELLLKCRADPNQIDKNGNTPLHFIVRSSIDLKTQHEIITHLIEYGAHIDRANHHGDSVCDEVTTILGTSRHINLKCLAARVVRKNEIPYVGEVPVDLYEFIEMH